jgi:hypothetical protein
MTQEGTATKLRVALDRVYQRLPGSRFAFGDGNDTQSLCLAIIKRVRYEADVIIDSAYHMSAALHGPASACLEVVDDIEAKR